MHARPAPARTPGPRAWLTLGALLAAAAPTAASEALDEVVVTARRQALTEWRHDGNIARLSAEVIQATGHHHVGELLNRAPGVWVVRGNGHEHQTAIRSPVLGGGGACGGFLFLEDGIPIRPAGFCTINQAAELLAEQARAVEVVRGPGNALYGSGALHGLVNVLMPEPGQAPGPHWALEAGAHGFLGARALLPGAASAGWLLTGIYSEDDGFRDQAGHRQAKLHARLRQPLAGGDLTLAFSATELDQDNAGFILGRDAWRDASRHHLNPTPGAFREAGAQRLYGIWTRSLASLDLDLRPYLRHSDMRFMHWALPGQPIEDNGHYSAGLLASALVGEGPWELRLGLDLEWSDAYLLQVQDGPPSGSAGQSARRPAGRHYDYDVEAVSLAPYLQAEYRVTSRLTLGGGLRWEGQRYAYANRMLSGNTREDGTPCPGGGCLYTRPADRNDRFSNLAPKVSAGYELNGSARLFATLARGFRAPQALELYRLQNGQEVADLASERIDSAELGLRLRGADWSGELTGFALRKRDSAFRDAEGFNVSGARSTHRGVELALQAALGQRWMLSMAASYARHRYDFTYRPPRGQRFVAGNDIDTAPRWLGNVELRFLPGPRSWVAVQLVDVGAWYLDPDNRHRYPGHSLMHLRAGLALSERYSVIARLYNLADRNHADRADFAMGEYRYLPGRGREAFVELRYAFD